VGQVALARGLKKQRRKAIRSGEHPVLEIWPVALAPNVIGQLSREYRDCATKFAENRD
jgi:hypothetical protein